MIIKMFKYAFLVYHAEYQSFLDNMKDLGVLHIKESANEPTAKIQDDLRMSQELKGVMGYLERRRNESLALPQPELPQAADLVALVKETRIRLEVSEQHKSILEKELLQFDPWGNFSWETIELLESEGVQVRFFQCSASKFNQEWEQEFALSVISQQKNVVSFVAFQPQDQVLPDLDAEEIKLPVKSLGGIRMELDSTQKVIDALNSQLDALAIYAKEPLTIYQNELKSRLQSDMAILNTTHHADGALMILEGFVPLTRVEEVNDYLEKSGVVYVADEAIQEDRPPILLKNNAFSRLFEPIGKLFELPSYMELDMTPFFAPFFMFFFGFCLGDAGYGLLLAIGAGLAKPKVKKEFRPYLSLVQLLGVGTLIMGSLTGTLFGAKMSEVDWPFIAKFQEMMLNDDQMFKLALMLGFVQILFGMVLKGINETIQNGFRYSFATWGWIIVIVSSVVMHLNDRLFDTLHLILLGFSALGIYVFNHPKRNVFVNVGAGLWDTYNMATGLLGDLLSYIRLFALGLAGGILGFVFNKLAFELSPDIPVLGFIITGVILIIGHSLNIFMSALGAFVHPMRLTFVEFYKNTGFAGGGKEYSPFRKI